MNKTFTETLYVICHNGADIIHPTKVEAGTSLSSGQPYYEEFTTEEEWKTRLTELGYVDPEPPVLMDMGSFIRDQEGAIGARTPEERRQFRQALREKRLDVLQSPQSS